MVASTFIDQLSQRPQPRFVASPALDRTAIDRLAGLPLAGGPHRPWVRFGTPARVITRQPACRDDTTNRRFGHAGQLLVIDLDETIRRQHPPPMIHEPLVAVEVCDQFCASGWKGQGWMKMRLMDGQCCVNGGASAVNNGCARECRVNEPS